MSSIMRNNKLRRLSWILLFLIIVGSFFLNLYLREQRLKPASFRMLNDAQTIWYPNPILHYHIIVDVHRPGETRRNDIRVENGEVVSATVMYKKQNGWGWEEPYPLNEDQSYPFTIPGLYDMVRGALRNSNRVTIRVDMQDDPPFPHEIEFGPVWKDGSPVFETESRVVLQEFERTNPEK